MTRIAIFGGSFDPPHWGHVLAVKYLLSAEGFDEVVVIPVAEHAFHKQLAPFETRIRLVQLAYADEIKVTVSAIEQQLPHPNYTLNTVSALQSAHPTAQFRLVVGADVLKDVDKWHRFDELVRLAPLCVLGRAGMDVPGVTDAHLPDISSSQVRALVKAYWERPEPDQLEPLRTLLPLPVLEMIIDEGLYR